MHQKCSGKRQHVISQHDDEFPKRPEEPDGEGEMSQIYNICGTLV